MDEFEVYWECLTCGCELYEPLHGDCPFCGDAIFQYEPPFAAEWLKRDEPPVLKDIRKQLAQLTGRFNAIQRVTGVPWSWKVEQRDGKTVVTATWPSSVESDAPTPALYGGAASSPVEGMRERTGAPGPATPEQQAGMIRRWRKLCGS